MGQVFTSTHTTKKNTGDFFHFAFPLLRFKRCHSRESYIPYAPLYTKDIRGCQQKTEPDFGEGAVFFLFSFPGAQTTPCDNILPPSAPGHAVPQTPCVMGAEAATGRACACVCPCVSVPRVPPAGLRCGAGAGRAAVTLTPSDIMSAAVRPPADISLTPPPAAIWCRTQRPRRAGMGPGGAVVVLLLLLCVIPFPPAPLLPASPGGAGRCCGAHLAGDGGLRRDHLPGARGRPAGGSPAPRRQLGAGAALRGEEGAGARAGGRPPSTPPTPPFSPARCRLRRRCGSIN